MKSSTLFAVLAAAAVSLTASAAGNKYANTKDLTGFEGLAANNVVKDGAVDKTGDGINDSHFYLQPADGAENATMALKYASDADKPSLPEKVSLPAEFASSSGDQYLKLNTEGATLWRTINAKGTAASTAETAPYALDDAGIYLDTVMKFTVSEEPPEVDDDAKIALWLEAGDTPGMGTLCIKAARASIDPEGEGGWIVSKLTKFETKRTLNTTDWYRVTIRAIKDITQYGAGSVPAFAVLINNEVVEADVGEGDAVVTGALAEGLESFVPQDESDKSNSLFPMGVINDNPTIFGLGFQGTGMVDDYVATTDVTGGDPAAAYFTMESVEGATAQYKIGDATEWETYSGKVTSEYDAKVYWQYVANDGYVMIGDNYEGDTTLAADETVFGGGVATKHVGQGTAEDPYLLAEVADFTTFVKTGEASKGKFYKMTANLDFSGTTWNGIGGFNGAEFSGTFDGNGCMISGVTFGRGGAASGNCKYAGFFGNCNGATIKNLTIEIAGIPTINAGEECGYAAFAGTVKGTTFQCCTAKGQIGTEDNGLTHTGAGFAVKTDGDMSSFVNCTNEVAIVIDYWDNPKVGGIVGLSVKSTFDGCVNKGSIKSMVNTCTSDPGLGGIIGYLSTSGDQVFKNCVNEGTITVVDVAGADPVTSTNLLTKINVGSIIGNARTVKTASVSNVTAKDGLKSVGIGSIDGLNFATVEDGVATFVADSEAAKNGANFKVMANGATVTLANAGDAITLDTTLATANVVAGAEKAEIEKSGDAEPYTYTLVAFLKYYATVYVDGQAYTWAGLGTGDAFYAKNVEVDAATAGVTNIAGTTYYVSKLVRKGNPDDLVCEFEYDGKTLTKKDGSTYDVTIDGTTLSYKVTTSEPYTLDSLGHACIGGIYYTSYVPPATPVVKIGENQYTSLAAAVEAAEAGNTLTLLADVELDANLACDKAVTFAVADCKLTVPAGKTLALGDNVTITRGTGGVLMLGTVSVAAGKTLDMSTFGFGSGIIASEGDVNAGNIALAATATIKFAAGTDPNAMLARNATFFKDTVTGATFYAGTTKYVYDSAKSPVWQEPSATVAPGGAPVQVEAESAEAAAEQVTLTASSPDTAIVSDADYTAYFKKETVANGDGTYTVSAKLDEDVVEPDVVLEEAATDLSAVAAGTATETTITKAKPGLFYSFEYSGNVNAIGTAAALEGDRVQAGANGSVTIPMPKTPNGATFYRVRVNTTQKGIVQ